MKTKSQILLILAILFCAVSLKAQAKPKEIIYLQPIPDNYKPVPVSRMDRSALDYLHWDITDEALQLFVTRKITIVNHAKEIYYTFSTAEERHHLEVIVKLKADLAMLDKYTKECLGLCEEKAKLIHDYKIKEDAYLRQEMEMPEEEYKEFQALLAENNDKVKDKLDKIQKISSERSEELRTKVNKYLNEVLDDLSQKL